MSCFQIKFLKTLKFEKHLILHQKMNLQVKILVAYAMLGRKYSQKNAAFAQESKIRQVTSMLVTNVVEEMCWRQLEDVGSGSGYFGQQHQLSFCICISLEH